MQKPAADVLGTLTLPTFELPPPVPLNLEQAAKATQGAVTRVFGVMNALEEPALKKHKTGINRFAASSYDRDSWITLITRLATRAAAGLNDVSVKDEEKPISFSGVSLSNSIRDSLYDYILEDFRKRIEVAVSWLSEEWYNDHVQRRRASDPTTIQLQYEKWAMRLLEGFLPYLHAQDKVLTRFLSEIPDVNAALLSRVKTLCRDPSTVTLALTSLLYLVMMRPPARELALDTVQDIWLEYDEAKPMAGKYLSKYRPAFIDAQRRLESGGLQSPPANGQTIVAT
jgi:symplekin